MQIVACKNDNFANLSSLIMFPNPYFTSFSFLECNFATIRNILMVLGRIIEQVIEEYWMQE